MSDSTARAGLAPLRDATLPAGCGLELIASVTAVTDIPVVACGGAGDRGDIPRPIAEAGASAAAAGSLFVFSGRERGVPINFPERATLEGLLGSHAGAA